MATANPQVIARNHQVEAALEAAVDHRDLAPFERLLAAVRRPFEIPPDGTDLLEPAPRTFTERYLTYCGT